MRKICSIDLDDILNYYPACWVDFINRETGLNFKNKAEAIKALSPEKYHSLKDRYRKSEFKANLPIRESALDLVECLRGRGYFIVVVTSRPFENYPQLADVTAKWLAKNNIPYDMLVGKSDLLSGKLLYFDFHVDDEMEDANLIAEVAHSAFLFDTQSSVEPKQHSIIRIKDVREVLSYLDK